MEQGSLSRHAKSCDYLFNLVELRDRPRVFGLGWKASQLSARFTSDLEYVLFDEKVTLIFFLFFNQLHFLLCKVLIPLTTALDKHRLV